MSPSCLRAIPSLGETLGLPLMATHGQLGAMSSLAKQRMMYVLKIGVRGVMLCVCVCVCVCVGRGGMRTIVNKWMHNIFFQDLFFQDDYFESSSWEVSVRERGRGGEGEGKLALILDLPSTQLSSSSLDIQLTRCS